MPGNTFSVMPGAPQQLSGAPLTQDTVIINNDASGKSVWLSSSYTVGPGNGVELTQFATATWTGKQLWACVDAGVIVPIIVTVSDDVSQINNPIGEGLAIAIQILAHGVPNVLVETVLETDVAPPVTIPVTAYSAITIAAHNNLNLEADFSGVIQQFISGQICQQIFYQGMGSASPAESSSVGFTFPVLGDSVTVETLHGSQHIYATGTNRTLPEIVATSGNGSIESTTLTIVAFTPFTIFITETCRDVLWSIDANFAGILSYEYYDEAGNLQTVSVAEFPATSTVMFGECVVPLGKTRWVVEPGSSATGTAALNANVVGRQ